MKRRPVTSEIQSPMQILVLCAKKRVLQSFEEKASMRLLLVSIINIYRSCFLLQKIADRSVSVLLLTSLLIMTACATDSNNEQAEVVMDIEKPKAELNDLVEISKLIQGVWLPREYIQDLYETRSAYTSTRSIPNVAELQIDSRMVKNDSLFVVSSLNNHEGYGFTIWVEQHAGKVIIKSNAREWEADKYSVELVYEVSPDTLVTLLTKDKNGSIIRRDEYLRIRDAAHISAAGGMGYQYLARKILLNGAYHLFDSANTDLGIVKFDAESGAVKGFKYMYYDIQTYFIGPDYEGDHILFQPAKDDFRSSESYVLKAETDTVSFYTTQESEDEAEYSIILKDRLYYMIKSK